MHAEVDKREVPVFFSFTYVAKPHTAIGYTLLTHHMNLRKARVRPVLSPVLSD